MEVIIITNYFNSKIILNSHHFLIETNNYSSVNFIQTFIFIVKMN